MEELAKLQQELFAAARAKKLASEQAASAPSNPPS